MSNLRTQSSRANADLKVIDADPLQHLKFRLYPETQAMLPIAQITEVLKLKKVQIMPIPQMPAWVMGVYNWRGDILWMVDLGQLLGLDSLDRHLHDRSLHTAIVLSPNRQERESESQIHLGLVVARVEDLENCDPEAIQAEVESQNNSQLNSFVRGYWLQPVGTVVLALDAQAIAEAMPTHNH